MLTYLDDGEAEHGSCHVADEHAGEGCHEHVGDEHRSRLRPRLAKNESRNPLVDLALGQGCGEGEATQKEHDHRRPHSREYVSRSLVRVQPPVCRVVFTDDSEHYAKERYQ